MDANEKRKLEDNFSNAVDYIICYLLGERNKEYSRLVSYGYEEDAKVIIIPSDFFNNDRYLTRETIPPLPLKEIDGLPILFGEPRKEAREGKLYLHADIVASSFFLMTRYEECVRREIRDKHGRFIGKESIVYKAGLLGRPIIEEWGELLIDYLNQMGIPAVHGEEGFSHIYLTHDVDCIWTWNDFYHATRSVVGRFLRKGKDILLPYKALIDYKRYDPVYTFEWLDRKDNIVKKSTIAPCEKVYFFMGTRNKAENDRGYAKNYKRTVQLMRDILHYSAKIGYHVSYQAASKLELQKEELQLIKDYSGANVCYSRNHYLDSKEPEDFEILIKNGITDDFTMGYADVAGFRLGTCRKVKWINPITGEVTPLWLHPMTIMDCTLDGEKYMDIQDEDEAYQLVVETIKKIQMYRGEIVLLWHNTVVAKDSCSYHRNLYERVLNYIASNSN